jgi:hypothetical protein
MQTDSLSFKLVIFIAAGGFKNCQVVKETEKISVSEKDWLS